MIIPRKFLRLTHLLSALVVSLYLLIASVTGAILGVDQALKSNTDSENVSVAAVISKVKTNYPELTSLQRDKEGQLELQAFDADFNEQKGYLDLSSGKITQQKPQKSAFIDWITVLHRSLFLNNTGRLLAGSLSVLFLVSLLSGFLYLIKNLESAASFWRKWRYPSFHKTYHLAAGRLFLLPLLAIALTASSLFLHRYKILKDKPHKEQKFVPKAGHSMPMEKFSFFQNLLVKDLVSIQFPFDETEPFQVETKSGKYQLDAGTGQVISQQQQDNGWLSKEFSFNIHTGRISAVWAWVAVLTVLSIPGFILTGFGIFLKRNRKVSSGFATPASAKVVILYGSENGSTRDLAATYARQLQQTEEVVFLGPLNEWQHFPLLEKLLILTATYGEGDAPANAEKFLEKIQEIPVNNKVQIGILGFGSSSYKTFNRFARIIRQFFLSNSLSLHVFELIDEHNPEDIQKAEEKIFRLLRLSVSSKSVSDASEPVQFKVKSRSDISAKNNYFQLELKGNLQGLTNGDLIQIQVPGTDHWRHYSVAVVDGNLHLLIKKVSGGLASEYLSKVEKGEEIIIKPEKNPGFHLAGDTAILIGNGTGIGPYLGMIKAAVPGSLKLYAGFRYREDFLEGLHQHLLPYLHPDSVWTYSREENGSRITAFLQRDASAILQHLRNQNEVLICGSLTLKHEIEQLLQQEIQRQNGQESVEAFYLNNLLKADCY